MSERVARDTLVRLDPLSGQCTVPGAPTGQRASPVRDGEGKGALTDALLKQHWVALTIPARELSFWKITKYGESGFARSFEVKL